MTTSYYSTYVNEPARGVVSSAQARQVSLKEHIALLSEFSSECPTCGTPIVRAWDGTKMSPFSAGSGVAFAVVSNHSGRRQLAAKPNPRGRWSRHACSVEEAS